ncbi:hypothetical protein [Idiomarina zobellii]|uniref:CorA-like Mg2+ transporter protein n=1 Tax=Idiomarina zobellii TaxID=86103 RepID=A0A837NFI8_9GAMM|nr:hypothetical protein [Idiomarina zobellii]KPD23986.1 hypothetical protein AFK76_05480 [Idiomarina zobellii]SDF84583.1 hypothetical protein SAMN04515658_105133 [Idiomarina zobellii]
MDQFFGRAYVFIPCYLDGKELKGSEVEKDSYVSEIADRFSVEVSNRSWNKFSRGSLGSYPFNFFRENGHENYEQAFGDVYFTHNELTGLCILTVVFEVRGHPITQLLDMVSREGLKIKTNETLCEDFYSYLKEKFALNVSGKARVCLSTGCAISDKLKPSIFASETYESSSMEFAGLTSNFGEGSWNENIAVYNSSQIFASKVAVLRHDEMLDKDDPELSGKGRRAIGRDLMLNFIIEVLMFREASIKRVNLKVVSSIQNDEKLDLSDIKDLMHDFKSVILFWDLDIFLYPSAQQLADKLSEKFDIDRALDVYRKNQSFLEQRVSLSNAVQAEKETKTLNYIAVIVFFFEVIPILFVLTQSVLQKKAIEMPLIYSGVAAVSVSVLLFLVVLMIVRLRKLTKRITKRNL